MTKPLYVDAHSQTRIYLDGPSLRVHVEGESPRRYPFRRVSRLVVGGLVEWSHEALVACLDHGVSVTFLSPDGAARGYGMPACDPATRENQRIEEFLSRPDWSGLYADWLRAMERREVRYALKVFGLRAADLRPETVEAVIWKLLGKKAPEGFARLLKASLDGMLSGRLASELSRMHMAPTVLVDRRPGFHFLRDATRVLGWRLYGDTGVFLDKVLTPRPQRGTQACGKALKDFYERRAEREERRIGRYLDSFRFWLGGL